MSSLFIGNQLRPNYELTQTRKPAAPATTASGGGAPAQGRTAGDTADIPVKRWGEKSREVKFTMEKDSNEKRGSEGKQTLEKDVNEKRGKEGKLTTEKDGWEKGTKEGKLTDEKGPAEKMSKEGKITDEKSPLEKMNKEGKNTEEAWNTPTAPSISSVPSNRFLH